MDENLVGGDLGGGSARIDQQLFSPAGLSLLPLPHARSGAVSRSASAHPGAGVHGACGLNAARMALLDHGDKPLF